MKKIFFSLLTVISFGTFAQKTTVINDKNAEKRDVKSFHAIKVSDGIDLYLSYGDEAVAVSARETKFRDKIKTSVEDGVLKIWYNNENGISITFNEDRKLRAYVSYKQLDMLSATSGSDVHVDGTLKADQFKLHISSGSDFEGKVDIKDMKIEQSSGSDIDIEGRAGTLSIEGSSGSDFNGYDLVADVCNIDVSSGSDVEITVNKELSARASSASDIHYKGSPTIKESKASGSSSISKRG